MRYFIFWGILSLTCGYALWRGRKYEQMAAGICIAASVMSVVLRAPVHQRYTSLEVSDLVIDTFVLLSFVAIALKSGRFWPLWAAGLQLTIGMSHVFKAFDLDLVPRVYAVAERF